MKLESQVCTLDMGVKLKKLGITQVSEYHHFCTGFYSDGNGNYPPQYIVAHHKNAPEGYVGDEGCSAFTVSELGVMLPDMLTTHLQYEMICINEGDDWLVRYCRGNDILDTHPKFKCFGGVTLADAMSETLIFLLENKIIEVEACNERLLA